MNIPLARDILKDSINIICMTRDPGENSIAAGVTTSPQAGTLLMMGCDEAHDTGRPSREMRLLQSARPSCGSSTAFDINPFLCMRTLPS